MTRTTEGLFIREEALYFLEENSFHAIYKFCYVVTFFISIEQRGRYSV